MFSHSLGTKVDLIGEVMIDISDMNVLETSLVGDEERRNSVRRIAFSLSSKEIVSLSVEVKIYNDEVKA